MYANPYISILMAEKDGKVKQGKTGNLLITAGNAGNDTLVKKSVVITISVPTTARIVSVSKVKKSDFNGWEQKSLTKGPGNTLQLVNKRKFEQFDLSQILINVKGEVKSEWKTITANIGFVLGPNADLDGAPSSSQGNATPNDDNSTTSITVI
jgi:lactate dehydrogenase-like 2-hydroxyacid dehydrogenase